jgi:hypothetical protein
MSTNHRHEWHGCEHKELKFCKECKVPYCNTCGKEWKENIWATEPNPFYGNYGYYASNGSSLQKDNGLQPEPLNACIHGDK